jgi:hypothetical protein
MLARRDFKGKIRYSGCVPGRNCQGDRQRNGLLQKYPLRHIGKAPAVMSDLRQLGKLAGGLADAKRLVGKQGGEWKSLVNRTVG